MTGLVWGVLVGLAIAVDVYLVAAKRESLSRWVWRQLPRRPYIGFFGGVGAGHMFWPGDDCLVAIQKGVAAVLRTSAVLLALLGFGCASHRAPDTRPEPPKRIEAHLTYFPPLPIAGQLLTLRAYLEDPEQQVRCPGAEWLYPDGTRSYHVADCDPDDGIERHYADPRFLRLGQGVYQFQITFDASGKWWRAATTVEVH